MKTKVKRVSKRTLAMILGVLMLVSSIVVGTILTADAWTDPKIMTSVTNYYQQNMTWNDASNYKCSYYFKHSDSDIYVKYKANNVDFGAYDSGAEIGNENNKKGLKNSESYKGYKYSPSWLSDDSKFHCVTFWFEGAGSEPHTWYTESALNNPVISKTLSSATQNTTYDLNNCFSTTNLVGTAQYSFVITAPSGAVTTSSSWTPIEAGNYTIEVVATDSGVVVDSNASSTRTASQTFSINVEELKYYLVGGFNNWTNEQSEWELKYIGNGEYSTVKTVTDSIEFKIRDNNDAWKGSSNDSPFWITSQQLGNHLGIAAGNGENFRISCGTGTYRFTFNPTSSYFVLSAATSKTVTVTDSDTGRTYSSAAASVDNASHYSGDTVTITTSPKAGYTAVLKSSVSFKRSGNKYTFTMPDSDVTVNVSYKEAASIPVVVYAGAGGTVSINHEGAVTNVAEGKNATIDVSEGDTISLTASQNTGYSFSKWIKNLSNPYQINSVNAGATISDESITKRTVYVASFSNGSSSSVDYDVSGWSDVSNTYKVKYKIGNDSGYADDNNYPSHLDTLSGKVYQSGSKFFVTLSSSDLTAWKNYGNNQIRFNLFQNSTAHYGNGKSVGLASGSSGLTFDGTTKERNGKYFVCVNSINSSVGALGILFNDSPGSGEKNITFYTATSSGGDSGDDYVPSTNYYAKDSAFSSRDDNGGKNKITYIGDANNGNTVDTVVTEVEDQVTITESGASYNHTAGFALKGSEITVKTTIPDSGSFSGTDSNGNKVTGLSARDKYYVAGFSFNGITPELLEENDDGVYTCTYTIPADMKETMLEITPIYFIREAYAYNTCVFYVNGFDSSIQNSGWGNTLFVYPYYRRYLSGDRDNNTGDTKYKGQAENFGAYSGQPLINYGGQIYTQVPLTNDGSPSGTDSVGNPIKGMTISNGYYDICHSNWCGFVSSHRQTYDYDDFQKIYKEKSKLHSVYYSFKYKTQDKDKQARLSSTTDNYSGSNRSRRNDLYTSSRLGENTTLSTSSVENYGTNHGGWENLQNALGENVDIFGNTVTNTSASPLRVISLGYEYNNSGTYATEWAVYAPDGSNYKLIYTDSSNVATTSSIVPSALVLNAQSSFTAVKYPQLDGDQSLTGYKDLYGKLEVYKGYPVKICYEYDAAASDGTLRCDGRWTYTTNDDYVQSKINIEYVDKNGVTNTVPYNELTNGLDSTTKLKAYFTNSEYSGKTISDSEIISNTDMYKFTAEEAGSYKFTGWYLKDTAGKENTITKTTTSAETAKSGNFTIIARFQYVAEGNLIISNSVANGQEGRARTYLGVTVVKADGTDGAILGNVNTNTKPITVPSSYISSNSTYKLRIDLRTVPTDENTFNSYSCNVTDSNDQTHAATGTYANIYDSSKSSNETDSYTITVKSDIYKNTTNQDVKAIAYVSTLNEVHYAYNITYVYNSREFGEQAFTKSGSLNATEIADKNVVTGTLNTNDKKLTKAYLTKIKPHESNFNEDAVWNIDDGYNSQTCSKNNATNTYTITGTVNSTMSSAGKTTRYGYFYVPYELDDESEEKGIVKYANSDAEALDQGTIAEENSFAIETEYAKLFHTDETTRATEVDEKLITAPAQIAAKENGQITDTKFFDYWSIHSNSKTGPEIARCYFNQLNYIAYDNYYIVAHYADSVGEKAEYQNYVGTTISYIGNSRNQWNNNGKGESEYYAGDLIYNDFVLSFKPFGNVLFTNVSGAQAGVIMQRIELVTTNNSGKNSMTFAEYAEKDKGNVEEAKSAAENYFYGNNTAGYTQSKDEIAVNADNINNKNRTHFTRSMWSLVQTEESATSKNYTAKNYWFRAFSYMVAKDINGNSKLYISNTPTYFTMYDIAYE